jgi:16S rRNA (cytidine1402-2'-O)-methyltransferase
MAVNETSSGSGSGVLYLVATPIGNLEDFTYRAVRVLSEAGLILCEDTRRTRKLLTHYDIRTRLESFHEHNERKRTPHYIRRIQEGLKVALVSDAGAPLISDPGFPLVRQAVSEGIEVICVPGACAAIAALTVSGLPTDKFHFEGFLPKSQGKRDARLAKLETRESSLVFYASPHEIGTVLEALCERFGPRDAVVCRELTKLHEENIHGPLDQLAKRFTGKRTLGEITLVVAGAPKPQPPSEEELRDIVALARESSNLSDKDLARQLADRFQIPRKQVYRLLIELNG